VVMVVGEGGGGHSWTWPARHGRGPRKGHPITTTPPSSDHPNTPTNPHHPHPHHPPRLPPPPHAPHLVCLEQAPAPGAHVLALGFEVLELQEHGAADWDRKNTQQRRKSNMSRSRDGKGTDSRIWTHVCAYTPGDRCWRSKQGHGARTCGKLLEGCLNVHALVEHHVLLCTPRGDGCILHCTN
jgi:hypothetical protein